jgi:hypothetical protein
MSITDSYEPVTVRPVGAIPQAPAAGGFVNGIDPSEPLHLLSRSGDTAVVFRLDRRLPFLHRLADRAAQLLDRLIDQRRILVAGAVVLLALGALAMTMGRAYRTPPSPHEPSPAAAAAPMVVPVVAPPAAAPAPVALPTPPPPAVRNSTAPAKSGVAHRTSRPKKPRVASRHGR